MAPECMSNAGSFRKGSTLSERLPPYLRVMNNVSLIGNLATDVELRDVGEDKKVAGFLLAVNRGSREAGADFVWGQGWERQAGAFGGEPVRGPAGGRRGAAQGLPLGEEGEPPP